MIAPKRGGSAGQIADPTSPPTVANGKRRRVGAKRLPVGDRRPRGRSRDSASTGRLAVVSPFNHSEQEMLRATVTESPIALTVVDADGVALLWNPAAERLFGWSAEEVVGHPLRIIDARTRREHDRLRHAALGGRDGLEVEVRRRHRDGHLVDVALSTVGLHDPDGRITTILATYQDRTGPKAAEAELIRRAHQDDLTGLINRHGLLEQLRKLQARRRRQVAVVALDLDHFKDVNDTVGHAMGDQVLTAFARRLVNSVRPSDVVARLEGATFGVLMVGISPSHLEPVVGRLLAAVSQRYGVAGHETALQVTAGVVSCSPADDPAEGVRRAEVAMHYAKQVSRGGVQVLDEALERTFLEQIQLSAGLLDAADQDELVLHFQPIMASDSGEMVGVEALVRWLHPTRGLLGPIQFISLAEQNGSISAIGRWVLHQACAALQHWTETEPRASHLTVSVNLSVAQLQDRDLVRDVKEALERSGLTPERLQLEITESVLSTDPEYASRTLEQLRDLGVRLAIDDFGTGNSSLSALQRYPFRILKIDRSFVGRIGVRPEDDTIVTATLALAHGLGLMVVAEGVETQEQAEFLTRAGCEQLQGYLFARPAPASVIRTLLAGRARGST